MSSTLQLLVGAAVLAAVAIGMNLKSGAAHWTGRLLKQASFWIALISLCFGLAALLAMVQEVFL